MPPAPPSTPNNSRAIEVVTSQREAAQAAQPPFATNGHGTVTDVWIDSPTEPEAVVAAFPSLNVRPGYALRGYWKTDGGNSTGVVYAVSEDGQVEAVPPTKPPQVPKPAGALPNVMEAVGGDGSTESYLSASILGREFQDFGSCWHGVNWGHHVVLTQDPFSPRNVENVHLQEFALGDPNSWKWIERPPACWMPQVEISGDRIVVTFLSHSAFCSERIYRHTDTYQPGSYVCESVMEELAMGAGGFIP